MREPLSIGQLPAPARGQPGLTSPQATTAEPPIPEFGGKIGKISRPTNPKISLSFFRFGAKDNVDISYILVAPLISQPPFGKLPTHIFHAH